jgi:hypothetical protein
MTLRFSLVKFPALVVFSRLATEVCTLIVLLTLAGALNGHAQSKPAANSAPDVLVLSNGDTLHGKFVSEVAGKVTFHTDSLGDVSLAWDKIKELHASQKFAVLDKNVKLRGKKDTGKIPVGTFDVADQAVTVHPEAGASVPPIAVKDAQYVMDEATWNKQVYHQPSFFSGWNGAATAGAAVVTATQNQFTISGGVAMSRVVPTSGWLDPRNRTSAGFTGSYGKITQPGYFAAGVFVPETVTKSAIFHAGAERDQYFSPRFYFLAETAFDHNFGQDLQLQQIYGGGIGWTALKTPKQEADFKATMQYEKQSFISGSSGNQNLIGSTFGADYVLHLKLLTYNQGLAFIPAYNQPRAYSANETNTVAFPAYKNLSFSLGTSDSYLNGPPASLPPTKRNSFQFTMGLTYAIKSKY